MSFLNEPWPWYVGGVLIGLAVPVLLLAGNKLLGVSSVMRHVCAACFPANIEFLKYDWRKQSWSLFFAAGIVIGGFVGGVLLADPQPEAIAPKTVQALAQSGVSFNKGFLPQDIFNWHFLFTLPGFLILVVGGFMVGFGTRYANGCTSGHGITGLSTLQWPSLIAVMSFFAAGILSSKYLLPFLLNLAP
jgi:uncharacterized membrane protein YedE/YeeE